MPRINVHIKDPPEPPSTAMDHPSLISSEKLWEIYVAMVKCRMLGQRAELLLQQGKIAGYMHTSAGREPLAAAFVTCLQREDVLSLSSGDWMPAFIKGVPMEKIFLGLGPIASNTQHGTSDATWKAWRACNVLEPFAAVEDQLKMVCNAAQDAHEAKNGTIAMAFFPGQPDTRDSSQQAIAVAGTRKLPVVFVEHSAAIPAGENPRTARGSRHASPEETICGVPVMVVDGNDAVAQYRVACEAIARARQGRGPTLVKSLSPDYAVATAPGAGCIYKGNEQRIQQDPILAMENYLRRKGLFSEELKNQMIAGFSVELDLVTRFFSG